MSVCSARKRAVVSRDGPLKFSVHATPRLSVSLGGFVVDGECTDASRERRVAVQPRPAYANRNCFLADSGPSRANNRFFSASERLGVLVFSTPLTTAYATLRAWFSPRKSYGSTVASCGGGEKEIEQICYYYGTDGAAAATFSGRRCWLALDVTGIRYRAAVGGGGGTSTSNNTCVTERSSLECGSSCREKLRLGGGGGFACRPVAVVF